MSLPKPWKLLLTLIFSYAVCVLLFHFGRGGMPWDRAFLFALVGTPLALVLARFRDRSNAQTREAGRRWGARGGEKHQR